MLELKDEIIDVSSGFTLLELLLSLALLSLLLLTLYTTFFSVVRAEQAGIEALDRNREIRRFLDIISMEARSVYVVGGDKGGGFTTLLGESRAGAGGNKSTLTFTTYLYPLVHSSTPGGDLVTVRYSVGVDEEGVRNLYKERWNPFSITRGGGSGGGDDTYRAVVVEGIEAFSVAYYNGREWLKSLDSGEGGGAPEGVKITLSLPEGGTVKDYSTVARVIIKGGG